MMPADTADLANKRAYTYDKNAHPFVPHICTIFVRRKDDIALELNPTEKEQDIPETGHSTDHQSQDEVAQDKEAAATTPENSGVQNSDIPTGDTGANPEITEDIIRDRVIRSLIDSSQQFVASLYYEFIPVTDALDSESEVLDNKSPPEAKINILNHNINVERLLTLLDEFYNTEMTSAVDGGKIYVYSDEDQKYMLVDPLRVFFGNIPYSTTWKRLKKFITNTVRELDPTFQLHIVKVEIPLIDASAAANAFAKNPIIQGAVQHTLAPNASLSSSLSTSSVSLSSAASSNAFSLSAASTASTTPISTVPPPVMQSPQQYIQLQQTPHGDHVKSRGFGIVTTTSQQTSKKLIDIFNNMEFDKRVLTVRFDRFPEFSNHHNSTNFRQHQNFHQQHQQTLQENPPHPQQMPIAMGHRSSIGSKPVFPPNSSDYFNLGYERNKYLQLKFYSPNSYMSYMYYPMMPGVPPPPPPPPPIPHAQYSQLPLAYEKPPYGNKGSFEVEPNDEEDCHSDSSSPPSPTAILQGNVSALTLIASPSSTSTENAISIAEASNKSASTSIEPERPESSMAYLPQYPGAPMYGHPINASPPYGFYYGGILPLVPPPSANGVDGSLGPMQNSPQQYYGYMGQQNNAIGRNTHPLVAAAAIAAQQKHSQIQHHNSPSDYVRAGQRSRATSNANNEVSSSNNSSGNTLYLNVHNSQIVHRANSKYFERRRSRGSNAKRSGGSVSED